MKIRILFVTLVAALVAGCSSFDTVKAGEDKVKYQVISTGQAEDRVKIINVVAAKSGDLAKASVELKNDSGFPIQFEYRFKWYDQDGMEINPEGGSWIPLSMMAQETKSVQALAPNPTGATFKLFLQEHK
jgi:uncharacterized protein YcfL